MKHIRKIMSAILALTLVLTSSIIPAIACTVEYDGHEPKVIPCEQVAEKGYCDILLLHYGAVGGEMRPWLNPYYKDTAEVTETPVTTPIETEPVTTEAPVETTPVEEQPFADVTVTEVVSCKYDEVEDFSEGLAAVWLDGKFGFIDTTGKEVVPLGKYARGEDFDQGFALVMMVVDKNYKYGFIDTTGKEVVPPKYDAVRSFSDGLAAVALNGKWGFIDKTGKEVVPPKYDAVRSFSDGLAAVELNGKWGFIDKTGKEVVPCKYDGVWDFDQGLAMVALVSKEKQNSDPVYKWGFIDRTGKEVVPCKYFEYAGYAPAFHEGLAVVKVDTGEKTEYGGTICKWGFIDKTGKEVVPCKYDEVRDFDQGLAAVELNGKWGFIDKTGKEVVPLKYDWAWSFSEGLAAVSIGCNNYGNGGKWGFIDKTGREVVPCKYDQVGSFSEGLARVSIGCDNYGNGGKWGFIDKTGKEVVPCKYDRVSNFDQGLAAVRGENYSWGFIDKTGKEVVPCKYTTGDYDYPCKFHEGLAAVCDENGKWGFISVNGAAAPIQTAKENVQTVKVDGKDVSFAMYSPDGGGTNYVRLVDLAVALNGTAGQYNVGYDGRVLLTSHTPYEGGTSTAPFHEPMTYTTLDEPTYVDGTAKNLEAIRFEYQNGGYTYYKLRDLGEALGFNVGWDNANQRIYIESNKPYDPNN